jgi:hypothetical protein
MARIRASCPTCGDVELTTQDVSIRTWAETDQGEYQFGCPICTRLVIKTAEAQTLDLLAASGVDVLPPAATAPMLDSAGAFTESPLTHDELLDFHLHLADESALNSALETLVEDVEP